MKMENGTPTQITFLAYAMLLIIAASGFAKGNLLDAQQGKNAAAAYDIACSLGRDDSRLELMAQRAGVKSDRSGTFIEKKTSKLSDDSSLKGFERFLLPEKDISFDDSSGLSFQRFFHSESSKDVGLGCGWTYNFTDTISIAYDRAVLTTAEGAKIEFEGANKMIGQNTATMEFISVGSQPHIRRRFEFENPNILEEIAGANQNTYFRFGEEFLLIKAKDAEGNVTRIKRYSDGRIARISKDRDHIDLNWSESPNPRLLSLIDNKGRKIKFVHRGTELMAVKTALGHFSRYKYMRARPNEAKVAKIVVLDSRSVRCISEDKSNK